jgi:hypothetical protein
VYERFVGPIPDDHQLRHVCGGKGCVNPEHLLAVKNHEAPKIRSAVKTTCRRGHVALPLPEVKRIKNDMVTKANRPRQLIAAWQGIRPAAARWCG